MSFVHNRAKMPHEEEGSPNTAEKTLAQFIAEDPNSTYTFDSERGAPLSELCREDKDKGRKCIMLRMYSTRLFQAMQDQGFYCALPMDPTRTHIECKRLPKSLK